MFVKISGGGRFHKFEKNKPITIMYLTMDKSKKFNRDLVRGFDREKKEEIVFPLYENLKLALSKIPLRPGDLLRITYVDDRKTSNGTAKIFEVEYCPVENVSDLTDYEKQLIATYSITEPEDKPPF